MVLLPILSFDAPGQDIDCNWISLSIFSPQKQLFPGGPSFKNVTDVKYMYRMHVLAVALREKDFFSELLVFNDGDFRTRVGVPISEFGESYIGFQGADKEEEWYTILD